MAELAIGLLYFIKSINFLYITRFVQGLFIASISPTVVGVLKMNSSGEHFGKITGMNQSCIFLGNVIGPILAGLIFGYLSTNFVFILLNLLFFYYKVLI